MGSGGPGGYRHNPNRDRNNMVSLTVELSLNKHIVKLLLTNKQIKNHFVYGGMHIFHDLSSRCFH